MVVRDERTWWLVVELDGAMKAAASIIVSGRERLMNSTPEQREQLLGARFDEAVRKLREDFLKNA